jgi:SNF2 family DNA or RNA helicase
MLKLRSILMRHQQEALRRARSKPEAFAHLAETGCGKSVVVLAEWQERIGRGPNDLMDLLVIAPAGSMHNWYLDRGEEPENWSELRKHLDPRLLEAAVVASNRGGAAMRRQREKLLAEKKMPRILFVNIEALSQGKGSKAELLCKAFLSRGRAMMVIDESTKIRHRRAARTKALLRLGRLAKSRRILTGLVTPRSPLDLFSQFGFLDESILGFRSFIAFRARYAKVQIICDEADAVIDMRLRQACYRRRIQIPDATSLTREQKVSKILELGGWIQHIPIVTEYKNLDELRRRIAPYSHQVLKADCLDLPPKIYSIRDVTLTDEQRRLYKEILQDATAQLSCGAHVTVTSALAQITRLHQVACGHVRDEEGKLHDVPSNRLSEIKAVLDEHSGKAIVWTVYVPELEKIADGLEKEYGPQSVARFWGGNIKTRGEDERRFLTDPACRYIVSTSAGSMGNTWNAASLVVYAANSWDLEFRHQSEDRCHRRGQTQSVTYVDLVTRGTVDEKILHALRRKIDLASAITGENWRSWVV